MKATFVVHEATPTPGKTGSTNLVLRPVVNEPQTNRDWSPGSSPTGEIRMTMTNAELSKKLAVGQRLEITIAVAGETVPTETPAATAVPADTEAEQAKKAK